VLAVVRVASVVYAIGAVMDGVQAEAPAPALA